MVVTLDVMYVSTPIRTKRTHTVKMEVCHNYGLCIIGTSEEGE